jgi:5'-nucleotidase
MENKPLQILLTNDDGIRSPGLWAAAEALSELGFVQVAAPREQFSGAGRSLPISSDGIIQIQVVQVNGKPWEVYAVGGTPAQAVLHAVLEIMPKRPDLVVSGINYGENLGSGITISGTVGAAMEAAAMGIPSLAVSLETETKHHYSLSEEIDFTVAAYFTAYFSRLVLANRFPHDVDLLKVDVPCDATPDTPWGITRLSHQRYFEPMAPKRASWDVPARVSYRAIDEPLVEPLDTDVYALRVSRIVSVTPLSLDMTSRIDLPAFERVLRENLK